ncbi:helix-turn-helix transcriptional regulator [Roseateles sp. P5_E11]
MQTTQSLSAIGQTDADPSDTLRLPRVRERTGLGRSTIYRLMALKLFPSAVQLGPRAVGWYKADIDAWLAARPKTSH